MSSSSLSATIVITVLQLPWAASSSPIQFLSLYYNYHWQQHPQPGVDSHMFCLWSHIDITGRPNWSNPIRNVFPLKFLCVRVCVCVVMYMPLCVCMCADEVVVFVWKVIYSTRILSRGTLSGKIIFILKNVIHVCVTSPSWNSRV